jgi:hypothetical protein
VQGIIIGSGDLVDACKADIMPASDSAPRIDDAEALVLVPTHPFPITFLSPETLCISLTSFLVFCSLGLGNCFGFGRRGRVGVRIMRGVVE